MALAYGLDKHVIRAAQTFKPDIIGCSVMTGFQNRWIRIAKILKQSISPAPLVVFGGPHPTFFPQVILEKSVDVVFQGESELAFADFLCRNEQGERNFNGIPNITIKDGNDGFHCEPMRPLADLDSLPFPDRQISFEHRFIRKDPSVHYLAGRGCPFSCSFCYSKRMREMCRGLGTPYRLRSVENLLEEIEQVLKKWGIGHIYFVDDTFCLNKKWLFEFL